MKEEPNYYAIIPANVRYDEELRANEKLMYGEITALTYKTGECWASNNYFARLYKTTPQAISRWIINLQKKGYLDIEYEYEGEAIKKRILKVSTNIDRGINKCLGGYQQKVEENNTSINNTSINNKEIYKESFERIWEMYPNKKGKANAYKSYEKAMKDGESEEKIFTGLQNYIAYIETERIEPRYIKNGSTWFNQKCWDDDYSVRRKVTTEDLAKRMDFTDFLNEGRI